jgi:hypothetical protein
LPAVKTGNLPPKKAVPLRSVGQKAKVSLKDFTGLPANMT